MELETFFEQFELLADAPNGVQKLQELILQLAVQGKLVPQDPNDEPASVLLERIEAEKKRLVKEGKIKKSEKLPPVDVDKIPYGLPEQWLWSTFSQLCSLIIDGDHNPPKRVSNGIPHLTARNVINNRLDIRGCTFITEVDFERIKKRYSPEKNDIVLTCVGTLGRTAIVSGELIFSADRNLAILRPFSEFCIPEYLQIVLNSPQMQEYIRNADGNTAQPHIYLKQIRALMCPLPPIKEQKRIVTKVDRLMSLCDELEAKLKQSISDTEKLMETAARQVLAA
jgi:type I restriction enzyme S subunit